MFDFNGKVAVVTGAASGIGFGIARALSSRGTAVVMMDIEPQALDAAVAQLSSADTRLLAIAADVSDRKSMYAAAERVEREFGRLDILVNNAGVAYNSKPLHETPDEMIDWSIGVNLFGVLNGIKAFVPLIIATGPGGHVVNTSSIGGFQVRKSALMHQGLYAATKFAVTALSEALRDDLEDLGIGVTILAPSAVATNIGTSDRNRQDRFGGETSGSQLAELGQLLKDVGVQPDEVGEQVIGAIETNALYVFTHLEGLPILQERHRRIEAAFESTRAFLRTRGGGGVSE